MISSYLIMFMTNMTIFIAYVTIVICLILCRLSNAALNKLPIDYELHYMVSIHYCFICLINDI